MSPQYAHLINKKSMYTSCTKSSYALFYDKCTARGKMQYFADCPEMCAAILHAWCDDQLESKLMKEDVEEAKE